MSHLAKFHSSVEQKIKDNNPNINFKIDNYLNVFSNNEIELSNKIYEQINEFIKAVFKLSRHTDYQDHLLNKYSESGPSFFKKIPNYSVLMSYDFHIVNDQAKLIEINTNASSYMIGNVISDLKNKKTYLDDLKKAFTSEFKYAKSEVKNIAIIDENPTEQNLFLEFQLYIELFKVWGFKSSIIDINKLTFKNNKPVDNDGEPIDFIYNRYCDFYLTENRSKALLESYKAGNFILSPQPVEYFLLADKQRMIDWQQDNISTYCSELDINILQKTLLETKDIQQFDPEELWKNKKKYFFKPKKSFGGKSVYRGKGITKKVFERLLNENTLVQELAPPSKIITEENEWKYDLRVYCYKDRIDQIVARTYKGQTTNASTLGGGISLVHFK